MNCILSGVGGQGTVLASKLIARCAISNGLPAHTAETIGMAQRGGCVVSHVRVGGNTHSPLISFGQADLIIGFEPAEAVRCLPYLKPGGTVVVSAKAIRPVTASLSGSDYDGSELLKLLKDKIGKNLLIVDGEAICRECGSSKVLNTALLGAALATGALQTDPEKMEQALRESLPERFVEMNLRALRAGMQAKGGAIAL